MPRAGFLEALARALVYIRLPEGRIDERGFAMSLDELRREDHAEMLAHHYVSALDLTAASGDDSDDLATR